MVQKGLNPRYNIVSWYVFRRNRMFKSVGEFMSFIFIQGMARNIPDPLFVGLAVFLV